MKIVDVGPGDPRLVSDLLPVLAQLRPHMDAPALAAVYEEGWPQGLRFTAAYDASSCVGVAGWRIVANTSSIRKLYIDDLVTSETSRSRGVGQALVSHLVERAAVLGCTVVDLDSGVQRSRAHRFYMREGMAISAFHFTIALSPAAGG
ncbi:MAG: GNAT family N-acetyltransferase [Actinomycetota bacterium]|nr:GNAT family N-acetyltransferase [Actinomycetota bacterium]